jgi:hypothetical protein
MEAILYFSNSSSKLIACIKQTRDFTHMENSNV